jgi:hypothetical protein
VILGKAILDGAAQSLTAEILSASAEHEPKAVAGSRFYYSAPYFGAIFVDNHSTNHIVLAEITIRVKK